MFTNIRNAINNREGELLLELDKQFEKIYFNEDILKENEKLPNSIKISLEKGKSIEKEWNNNNNKLNSLINDCINIENNIKNLNLINDSIKKYESIDSQLKFNYEEKETCILESIQSFGNISNKENNKFYNINIKYFNPQNITYIKTISDHCGYGGNSLVYDGICFFISKKDEYVLAYIDSNSNSKSIIFYDINNNNEIKKFNNAHEKDIHTIRYYIHNLYDFTVNSFNSFFNVIISLNVIEVIYELNGLLIKNGSDIFIYE